MTFFTVVATAVAADANKRLFVEITGAGEGRIRAIITPDLGEVPEDASAEVAQVYALMARPVVVTGLPAEVEAALSDKLQQASRIQAEGEDTLAALRQIQEQAKANAAKAPKAAKAAPVAEDDEDEPAEQEDTLEAFVLDAGAPASIGAAF
ncbi:PRTRC system protein E OS=Stutzerimonas stutzeri OX=316 GN=G7024_19850 PE=4 SV=1 [Stutzerimonas stutzeri]